MQSAETVILDLYRSGEIKKACLTITGGDPLWRDLEQECVLILLEKDPAKILQIQGQGYFKFYVVRLLLNLYRGKNNQFAQKYRHHDCRIGDGFLGEGGSIPIRQGTAETSYGYGEYEETKP